MLFVFRHLAPTVTITVFAVKEVYFQIMSLFVMLRSKSLKILQQRTRNVVIIKNLYDIPVKHVSSVFGRVQAF